MDLKAAKRLIAYARRVGVKSLKVGEFEVTFHDAVIFPTHQRAAKTVAPVAADKQTIPAPAPDPTLEDINAYIYGNTEESH